MQHLIGINGFKTAGKDTTYSIIRDLYGNTAEIVARAGFADKLKVMASRALDLSPGFSDAETIALMDVFKESGVIDACYLDGGKTLGRHVSGREYLQLFGANAREVFGDSFWIDQVLPSPYDEEGSINDIVVDRGLKARYPGVDVLCITDVRYPNEAERVKELGGVVWEVLRPGLVSDGHSSEKPLPPSLVDYRIVNDGDLETLKVRVMTAMETL